MPHQHQLRTPADCRAKTGYCQKEGACMICDGGLCLCKVCGGLEGSLTVSCPGVHVPMDKLDQVYAGEIDFVYGEWVELETCSQCQGKWWNVDGQLCGCGALRSGYQIRRPRKESVSTW